MPLYIILASYEFDGLRIVFSLQSESLGPV